MCDNEELTEIQINQILNFLDGWILASTDAVEEETSEMDDLFTDDETYNKIITSQEIQDFYDVAKAEALSYLGYSTNTVFDESLKHFLYMWTAGIIYRKYDIRPSDLVDETYPVGYGDQLVISAKTGLKPFKKYRMSIF